MALSVEQFAIVADMIGSRLAPDNPFAGVGTFLGQSSLAEKKADDLRKRQEEYQQQVLDIQRNQGSGNQFSNLIGGLTAKGQPGATSASFTQGENGLEFKLNGDAGSLPNVSQSLGNILGSQSTFGNQPLSQDFDFLGNLSSQGLSNEGFSKGLGQNASQRQKTPADIARELGITGTPIGGR